MSAESSRSVSAIICTTSSLTTATTGSDDHRFEDVVLAWEEQDFLERIAELVAGDCSLHEAVGWTIVEEAKRYTVAQWADSRGVTEDAVRSNGNAAREKLLTEEDQE